MKLLAGKTIFMLEDEPLNMAIIRTILIESGARVLYAHWGEEVMERILRGGSRPDAILLDLYLPGKKQGHDVFAQIKEMPEFQDIPIVAISAADPDVEIPRTKRMGYTSFISKPISRHFPKQLASILEGEQIWGDAFP